MGHELVLYLEIGYAFLNEREQKILGCLRLRNQSPYLNFAMASATNLPNGEIHDVTEFRFRERLRATKAYDLSGERLHSFPLITIVASQQGKPRNAKRKNIKPDPTTELSPPANMDVVGTPSDFRESTSFRPLPIILNLLVKLEILVGRFPLLTSDADGECQDCELDGGEPVFTRIFLSHDRKTIP